MKPFRNLVHTMATALVGAVVISSGITYAADLGGKSSGFLDPSIESQMQQVEIGDGTKVMRWKSPALAAGDYQAVMIDRVIFYPAPNPGPQASSKTLEEIADYLTDALRRDLGKDVKVVDKDQLTLDDSKQALDEGAAAGAVGLQQALAK